MHLKHMISCIYLLFIRRIFRMKEHMVLWILCEVTAITTYSHLLKREPAIARLTKMSRYGKIFTDYKIDNRFNLRIVNHNKTAIFVSNCHSNIFPKLHSNGSSRDIPFQMRDYLIAPTTVSYTHLRAHETGRNLVCRLLLEKKKK